MNVATKTLSFLSLAVAFTACSSPSIDPLLADHQVRPIVHADTVQLTQPETNPRHWPAFPKQTDNEQVEQPANPVLPTPVYPAQPKDRSLPDATIAE